MNICNNADVFLSSIRLNLQRCSTKINTSFKFNLYNGEKCETIKGGDKIGLQKDHQN